MSAVFSSEDFVRLVQYKTAKANFVDEIYNHAMAYRRDGGMPPLTGSQVKQLRVKHEAIAMICEIFALLSFRDDSGKDCIRFVLEAHNAHIDALLGGSEGRVESDIDGQVEPALPVKRLREAKFTERQIRMTQRMSRGERVEINERTLGKLLSTLMSFESCRKLVELLDEAGLLNREDYGHVLVESPGHLERFYSQYLKEVSLDLSPLEAAE